MQTKLREAFIDLYYEDVVIGDVVLTDSHTFAKEDIVTSGISPAITTRCTPTRSIAAIPSSACPLFMGCSACR